MNHEEHKGHEGIPDATENVARAVVEAALKVHKALGPGLSFVSFVVESNRAEARRRR